MMAIHCEYANQLESQNKKVISIGNLLDLKVKTGMASDKNLVMVSTKEGKLLEDEDDGLRLTAAAVQALQEELEVFGERPINLEWWNIRVM